MPWRVVVRAEAALDGRGIEIRKDFDAVGGRQGAQACQSIAAGFRIPLAVIERDHQRTGPFVAQQ